jgi:6-phosphogluconolactonase
MVRTLDVEPSGALTHTDEVPAGTSPRDVALDPRQRWAFVSSADEIRTFRIESDGTLSDTGLFAPTGPQPTAIEVDPSGRFLFLIDEGSDLLTPYSIAADGELSAGSALATSPLPRSIAIDPTGRFVFVGNDGLAPNGAEGAIRSYPFDPRLGSLGAASASASAPGSPWRLRFAQEGDLVYATLAGANFTLPYEIDATSGEPTPPPPDAVTSSPSQPRDVVLTPDGRFGFVVARSQGNPGRVHAYDVRASDGALWNEQAGTNAPKQSFETPSSSHPIRLAVSPGGNRLYVLHEGLNLISVLNIGPNGLLGETIPPALTGNMPRDMELRTVLQ